MEIELLPKVNTSTIRRQDYHCLGQGRIHMDLTHVTRGQQIMIHEQEKVGVLFNQTLLGMVKSHVLTFTVCAMTIEMKLSRRKMRINERVLRNNESVRNRKDREVVQRRNKKRMP